MGIIVGVIIQISDRKYHKNKSENVKHRDIDLKQIVLGFEGGKICQSCIFQETFQIPLETTY